jgi:hypothetical protein
MDKFLFQAWLPNAQHDGTSNARHIHAIKLQVAQRFGGYTTSQVEGGWFDQASGHLYEDASTLLSVFVDTQADVDLLVSLAQAYWAQDLQQIELLVAITANVDVRFVEGTRAQALA